MSDARFNIYLEEIAHVLSEHGKSRGCWFSLHAIANGNTALRNHCNLLVLNDVIERRGNYYRIPQIAKAKIGKISKVFVCQKCAAEFVSKRADGIFKNPPKYCPRCRSKMHSYVRSTKRAETRYTDDNGYVHILKDGKFKLEHSVVMEDMLGRKLIPNEQIHHINGIRSDNTPSNLELRYNNHGAGIACKDLVCPHCGASYIPSSPKMDKEPQPIQ